jgi:hypothetical protein
MAAAEACFGCVRRDVQGGGYLKDFNGQLHQTRGGAAQQRRVSFLANALVPPKL